MSTATAAPDSGQPGLSQGARIVNTFFAPSKTFTDIKRSASWWAPFLLMAVVSLSFVYTVDKKVGFDQVAQNNLRMSPKQADRIEQLPPEQREQAMGRMVAGTRIFSFGFPVIWLGVLALVAAILMATFNFGAGAEIPYKTAFAVVIYASLPRVLRSIAAVIALMAGLNPEGFILDNPIASNPGHLFNPVDSRVLYTLASQIDLFVIWTIVLMGIGFSRVSKLTRRTTISVVAGWYAFLTIVFVGWAAIFS